MQAHGSENIAPLVRIKVSVRLKYHISKFKRWVRRDKTTVVCAEDLEWAPPPYQSVRRTLPVHGELDILRYILAIYQNDYWHDYDPFFREVIQADIDSLSRWIEHLEHLVYWDLATRTPSRYRHEPIKDRIIKRIKRLWEDSPSDNDEFLGDEVISVDG